MKVYVLYDDLCTNEYKKIVSIFNSEKLAEKHLKELQKKIGLFCYLEVEEFELIEEKEK
jgi:hypothetical protein